MADDGSDIPKLTNAPLLDTDGSGAPVLRRGLFRLLVLQSLAFFLNFAAFNAAQSLDGSIPAPAGLAPIQFMAIYVTFAILCIPAPKLLSVIGRSLGTASVDAQLNGEIAQFLQWLTSEVPPQQLA